MSTRAAVGFREGRSGAYQLYYRHCDGYPGGLGIDLIEALKKAQTIREVVKEAGLENMGRLAMRESDIFPKAQGDLEWFYLVDLNGQEFTSVRIYKTSNPYFSGNDFSWRMWSCYLKYLPDTGSLEHEFRMLELIAHGLINFERAIRPDGEERECDSQSGFL